MAGLFLNISKSLAVGSSLLSLYPSYFSTSHLPLPYPLERVGSRPLPPPLPWGARDAAAAAAGADRGSWLLRELAVGAVVGLCARAAGHRWGVRGGPPLLWRAGAARHTASWPQATTGRRRRRSRPWVFFPFLFKLF